MLEACAVWILTLMTAAQPRAPWRDTYEETARSIAAVVLSRDPLPIYAKADHPRARSAALMVSLAWFESAFQPDAVGDQGRSRGRYQVQGHGRQEGAEESAVIAHGLLGASMVACRRRAPEERLAWYAAGGLGCPSGEDALRKSRHRVLKAEWLFRSMPPPAGVE